jgi:hypothetical protein
VARGALMQCRACRYQISVTAGTVMHRTRVPLRDWFCAAYLVTAHTRGFSALQLQRQLGLGRHETAWAMLQKLRRAMIRPERLTTCRSVSTLKRIRGASANRRVTWGCPPF